MTSVTIIIPCYNEAGRLPVEEYVSFLKSDDSDNVSLLFIDDGSTDHTSNIINGICEQFPERALLQVLEKNAGKAEAIRQGMISCNKEGIAYIGYFDADLATPLSEIAWLNSWPGDVKLPGMIIGSRVKLLGSTNISRYTTRHYFGRLFATVVSNLLHIPIYDTQCGAKLIKAGNVDKLFQEKFISRWLFDVELLFRMIALVGYDKIKSEVMEVPLRKWTEKGHSKMSILFPLKVPFELFRIYMKYRISRN